MAASTSDPAEIAKFGALADQWWNPKGAFRALHRLNPVRLAFILEAARKHFASGSPSKPLAGLDVADIGCGGGLASAPLARLGARVVGIDASPDAVGAARAYAEQAGLAIEFRCAAAEELAATGARFDLVAALEIVEHVANVNAFLRTASDLLRPSGLLAISTINRTAKARALAITGAERILQWAPLGAHDFGKFVTPEEIRAGANDIAWQSPRGIVFDVFGKGWSLGDDTDVNYIMVGTKL